MSNCFRCNSNRVAVVDAKCSDVCAVHFNNIEMDGFIPNDMGIGGDGYIGFTYCLDCGQMQGEFPVSETKLEKEKKLESVDPFKPGDLVFIEKMETALRCKEGTMESVTYMAQPAVGSVVKYDRKYQEVTVKIQGMYAKSANCVITWMNSYCGVFDFNSKDIEKTNLKW